MELKHVTISENATNGAFGDGTVAPVVYADAQCPAGYKAMFVDGIERHGPSVADKPWSDFEAAP